jgi:PaaA2-like antitoxin
MTLEQLRATAAAGGVAGVTLKGQGGAFMLRITTRSGQDAVLAKARSTEPRRFGNPASAMILLREVGIAVAQLDATDWNPDEKDMSRSRSSQAEAMRTAHRAAAHNRWLAAEIQASLDDPRSSIPHEEVMAALDAEIDAIETPRARTVRRKGA